MDAPQRKTKMSKRKIPHPAMRRRLLAALGLIVLHAGAAADENLARAKHCMACHAVAKKQVGPSYREVATRYAGQKDAADKLAAKIMRGGSGVWGPVPMPANPGISEADAKTLALWILSLQ